MRAAGYDTHYEACRHISHADLDDPKTGKPLAAMTPTASSTRKPCKPTSTPIPRGAVRFLRLGRTGTARSGHVQQRFRRDPLVADRVVAWLADRYSRRRAGDPESLRPFLLVASFVNPHDIVLFPGWVRRSPLPDDPTAEPPHVPEAPTATEDLSKKPAA